MERKRSMGMNHSMMDPNINSTLLEKTLHEESFEKLGESIVNSNFGANFEKGVHNEMPLLDKITMGPIEKYQKWNRYPWKMVVHIMLIALTTLQVVITIESDSNYTSTYSTGSSSQNEKYNRLMDRVFLTPEGGGDEISERYIFNAVELKTFIESSISNYYSLNEKSFEHYSYNFDMNGEVKGVDMDVLMFDSTYQLRHSYYYLNHSYLGPFDLEKEQLKSKFYQIF
jgi:hypothetical protein